MVEPKRIQQNQSDETLAALTADDIMKRMAETYASCQSYCDTGIVLSVFNQPEGGHTSERPFTTAFVRPDRFRFEFTNRYFDGPALHYIVWREGEQVRTWWDVRPGINDVETLNRALSGATGVSGSSAHTVPVLLLPDEIGGRCLTHTTELKRMEDAHIDTTDCFRIEGKYAEYPQTLWIEKQTFLIRRIERQMTLNHSAVENFVVENTTTYEPVVHAAIDPKLLEFNSPESK